MDSALLTQAYVSFPFPHCHVLLLLLFVPNNSSANLYFPKAWQLLSSGMLQNVD